MNGLLQRLLVALLLASTLSSCASWKRLVPERRPPRVDCQDRKPADPVPPLPKTGASQAWQRYALVLIDLVAQRDELRADSADCYDRARKAGDIR